MKIMTESSKYYQIKDYIYIFPFNVSNLDDKLYKYKYILSITKHIKYRLYIK